MRRNRKIIITGISAIVLILALLANAIPQISVKIDSLFTAAKLRDEAAFTGEGYVVFLDVGQGDCALVCSNEHYFLIDTGTEDSADSTINYLESNGVYSLDMIIITHPHEDHIGGASEIADELSVGQVLIGGNNPQESTDSNSLDELLDVCEEKNIFVSYCNKDESFSSGGALFQIYTARDNCDDENDRSLLIKVSFAEHSFLFTGDLTSQAEKNFFDCDLNADVLKVGHHGSKYSTCDEFLYRVDPIYAVISVGANSYGHPHSEVTEKIMKNGILLYRTDVNGYIVFKIDGSELYSEAENGKAA
ncbi:MAG: ComEC/Rec2 family competence protein [Acutalibacteraceae bacterium]